jgi:hypothetical protein
MNRRDRLFTVLTFLAIGGCAPAVVVNPPPPAVLGTGSGIVLKTQAMVRERCRFNVSADTVAGILGNAYLPSDVADSICLAVLQSRGDPAAPRVNGVAIVGRFVR